VLIASSYTVVLMVSAARKNSKSGMAIWMVLTMLLGGVFLGVKYFEYKAKWDHRLVPGKYFDFTFYELPHLMAEHGGSHGSDGPAGTPGTTPAHVEAPVAHPVPVGHEPAAVAHADHAPTPRRYDDMSVRGTDPSVPTGIMIYYSLYFAMSGMHALHMIIGEGIAIWLLILILKGRFSDKFYPHIEYFGLYWHFVDIVWIFLFPLLYLI
jgi:cytochrome c oxidase subunit 3